MALLALALIIDEENEAARRENIGQLRIDRLLLRDARNPFYLDPEYFRRIYRYF